MIKHVGPAEAPELTLLILANEPARFRTAALRWHARYCGDNKVTIEEATAVLGLLAMLDGRRAKPAAQALAGLLDSRTLLPAAEVLVLWATVFHPPILELRERRGGTALAHDGASPGPQTAGRAPDGQHVVGIRR